MKLLVAIPCLNEEASVGTIIRRVPRTIDDVTAITILVVDDGSTDRTADVAGEAGATVVRHPANRGVGAAFHTAADYALRNGFDAMINIDGDGQFAPEDIPKLLIPIREGRADLVTASRFIDPAFLPDMPSVKRVGNHLMARLVSRLCGQVFHDVSCGFRAYSREALLQINLHGEFTYTQETFLDLTNKKLSIVEIPLRVLYDPARRSRVAHSILRYAANTGMIIFQVYRDYFPLRFFFGIALAFFALAIPFGLLFFAHFLLTGLFTDYLFAGLLSAFFVVVGLVFATIAIVSDMLARIRVNQERIMYLLKRQRYSGPATGSRHGSAKFDGDL